jgi:hypothetical protein
MAEDESVPKRGKNTGDGNAEPWLELVTRWSFAAGIVIFLINMIVAWWVVCTSKQFIATPMPNAALASAPSGRAPINQLIYASRIQELNVHLRAMANQQTTVIIGMASAFSFMAVGFALFVMGIRSAFSFSGEAGPNHRLVLSSASPGILCFVLSTGIMLFALSRPIALQLGGINFQPDTGSATESATLINADFTNLAPDERKTLYEPPKKP